MIQVNIFKTLVYILFVFVSMSCSESLEQKSAQFEDYKIIGVDVKNLEQNFRKWWSYHNNHIMLSDEFIALNNNSDSISKGEFLDSLVTGNYIPVKLASVDSIELYGLYKLSKAADASIKKTIINSANTTIHYYRMEGIRFPEFHFIDLDGNEFTNESIKNKDVLVKCWFIGCTACVKEFPELNKMVSHYKEREDMEFISLAYDSSDDLRKFLKKKKFDYSVVPVERSFIDETLNIHSFPTHFIINKKGIIKKVINSYEELEVAMKRQGI
ncbi:redoxin domain-containing protein [uncultured Arcticibacterium sp.]|uniref:TlpA family protein disulfide reductase n=1 Tax=uncultured Arcticibacterium sp. TaxID=2173042 RepID=UPI0030FAAFB4